MNKLSVKKLYGDLGIKLEKFDGWNYEKSIDLINDLETLIREVQDIKHKTEQEKYLERQKMYKQWKIDDETWWAENIHTVIEIISVSGTIVKFKGTRDNMGLREIFSVHGNTVNAECSGFKYSRWFIKKNGKLVFEYRKSNDTTTNGIRKITHIISKKTWINVPIKDCVKNWIRTREGWRAWHPRPE